MHLVHQLKIGWLLLQCLFTKTVRGGVIVDAVIKIHKKVKCIVISSVNFFQSLQVGIGFIKFFHLDQHPDVIKHQDHIIRALTKIFVIQSLSFIPSQIDICFRHPVFQFIRLTGGGLDGRFDGFIKVALDFCKVLSAFFNSDRSNNKLSSPETGCAEMGLGKGRIKLNGPGQVPDLVLPVFQGGYRIRLESFEVGVVGGNGGGSHLDHIGQCGGIHGRVQRFGNGNGQLFLDGNGIFRCPVVRI